MFLVVYFIKPAKYIIVHTNWAENFDVEKHVKNSINPNQVNLCYYTTQPDAFDGKTGEPKTDWKPNFNVEILNLEASDDIIMEATFHCNFLKYFRK